MQAIRRFYQNHKTNFFLYTLLVVITGGLDLYRLGSLTPGLSQTEHIVATTPFGWHGIYQHPFFLPINLIRSIVYVAIPHHGATVSRVTSVLFGVIAVVLLARVLQLWYGNRLAILGSLLFAFSSWTLHVSRLANYDVVYLVVVPLLFLIYMAIRHEPKPWKPYVAVLVWGSLLTIPAVIWLVLLQIAWQRKDVLVQMRSLKLVRQRVALGLLTLLPVPLLLHNFILRSADFFVWLGLPGHFGSLSEIVQNMIKVPLYLFVHGPVRPDIWLGRMPLLDVFSLAMVIIGIYFYLRNIKASRSRWLFASFVAVILLIGLHGAVSLSLAIPILFIFAACGIGYLLHDWFKVFPTNPVARGIGIALLSVAVVISCTYNTRSYFVAWSHANATHQTFIYR